MSSLLRSPKAIAATIIPIFLGVGALLLGNGRTQAQTVEINPRDWASKDYRVTRTDDLVRAYARFSVLCGIPYGGKLVTGGLTRAANQSVLMDAEATVLACVLGAPHDATCDQVVGCYGGRPSTGQGPVPYCDGDLLRGRVVTARSKESNEATVACKSQGGKCYTGPDGAFCGIGPCESGETYTCDGDSIISCVHGVRVKSKCGEGLTCGAAPGSGVLDCVPDGSDCKGGARCDGGKLHQCFMFPFGAGRERAVDCSSYGLGCIMNEKNGTAACAQVANDCDVNSAPSCDGAGLKMCVAGVWRSFTCEQLGISGACQPSSTGVRCGTAQ